MSRKAFSDYMVMVLLGIIAILVIFAIMTDMFGLKSTVVTLLGLSMGAGDYDKAVQFYNDGNYADAISILEEFVRENPNDELAADAQYYLYLSYKMSKQQDKALAAAQKLVYNYPYSDKIIIVREEVKV